MGRAYVEIPKVIQQLKAEFGDKLGLEVRDNSKDGGPSRAATLEEALDKTGKYTADSAKGAINERLEQLRAEGKVSPEIYRQFTRDLDTPGGRGEDRGSQPEGTAGASGSQEAGASRDGNVGTEGSDSSGGQTLFCGYVTVSAAFEGMFASLW
jgi:hypothetical protein